MRRRFAVIASLVGAVALVGTVVLAYVVVPHLEDRLRRATIETLQGRFDSAVELDAMHVAFFPRVRVSGGPLVLRKRDRPDAAPLIRLDHFSAAASWTGAFGRRWHVERIEVEGLHVTITPDGDGVRDDEHGGCKGDRTHPDEVETDLPDSPVVVERLHAPGTVIELVPRRADKQPRRFQVHDLVVRALTLDRPFDFEADLTNPTPRGTIHAQGRFGPWVTNDPGLSPVSGRYRFDDADLGTIDGIEGELDSSGTFDGVLEQILVKGTTTTPEFGLTTGGTALPLETEFEACVDGTDGDTYLDRVQARLASTPITASGKVEGTVGVHGRTVKLEVEIADGRIEDVLRLAVNGTPLMRGGLSLDTRLDLPPGEGPVIQRLALDGRFGLERSRFTTSALQSKVDELSRRGRGDMEDDTPDPVASNLHGSFTLGGGVVHLRSLSFDVPGAKVRVDGRYGLVTETLAFEGTVRLDAKVSETTTGFKSLLLKVVDPLFSRGDAGTVLPIRVGGTREHPEFGVDVKKALLRDAK